MRYTILPAFSVTLPYNPINVLHANKQLVRARRKSDKEEFDGPCAGAAFLWMERPGKPVDHPFFQADAYRVYFPSEYLQKQKELAGIF